MTCTLYYVYDPMCSWCYAFEKTFEQVKEKLPSNVVISYIPGGLAPHSNTPMPKDMQEKIQTIWYQIENQVGTSFNHEFWEKCTPRRSTYLACQATLAAKNQDKEEEMIKAIQNAYYQRAMNPSDEDTMIALAQELDLDVEKFKKDLNSKETITSFEELLNLRRSMRVNSFPTLLIKYKKELYPLNIEYNNPQRIIEQIENITQNIYF